MRLGHLKDHNVIRSDSCATSLCRAVFPQNICCGGNWSSLSSQTNRTHKFWGILNGDCTKELEIIGIVGGCSADRAEHSHGHTLLDACSACSGRPE